MTDPIDGVTAEARPRGHAAVLHLQMTPDLLPIDTDLATRPATVRWAATLRAAIDVPVASQVAMP